MIILEDTRQQKDRHKIKHEKWMQMGVTWNRCTLVCGDYQLPGDGSVAVDTKKDIAELIGDIQCKVSSKKDIEVAVRDIYVKNSLTVGRPSEIFDLIVSDDSERFPEKEISEYCYTNGIPEGIMSQFQELYLKRHGFFHRGLIRAKQYGVHLYILVENTDGVKDLRDLFKWVNPRRKIMVRTNRVIGYNKNGTPKYQRVQKYPNCAMGSTIAKACITMEKKYGVKFVFCTPQDSAETIINLLNKSQDIKTQD